jgi:hypothetical protein
LLTQPLGCRVRRNTDPQDGSPTDAENDERKQAFKGQGGNDQEIYCRGSIRVITQERLPTLRRRPSSSDHVLRNSRLRDRKTELQQFAVNPRRALKRVFVAHAPHKIT